LLELQDRLKDIELEAAGKAADGRKQFLTQRGELEGQLAEAEKKAQELAADAFDEKTKQAAADAQAQVDRIKAELAGLNEGEKQRQDREKRRQEQIEAAKADAAKKRDSAATAEDKAAVDAELEETLKGINDKIDAEEKFQADIAKLKGKASAETIAELERLHREELARIDARVESEINKQKELAAQKKRLRDEAKQQEAAEFQARENELIERHKAELKRLDDEHRDRINKLQEQLKEERNKRKDQLAELESDRQTALTKLDTDLSNAISKIDSGLNNAARNVSLRLLDIAKDAGLTDAALRELEKVIRALNQFGGSNGSSSTSNVNAGVSPFNLTAPPTSATPSSLSPSPFPSDSTPPKEPTNNSTPAGQGNGNRDNINNKFGKPVIVVSQGKPKDTGSNGKPQSTPQPGQADKPVPLPNPVPTLPAIPPITVKVDLKNINNFTLENVNFNDSQVDFTNPRTVKSAAAALASELVTQYEKTLNNGADQELITFIEENTQEAVEQIAITIFSRIRDKEAFAVFGAS
jgi:hypothetical protein